MFNSEAMQEQEEPSIREIIAERRDVAKRNLDRLNELMALLDSDPNAERILQLLKY